MDRMDFGELNKDKGRNEYCGKRFSILGDSISTLEGYNPKGYALYYTGDNKVRTNVFEKEDTWWGKVIDALGAELLVNNSWSGSRVTRLPFRGLRFPSGCSDERTFGLHRDGVMPEVIIIFLGTNDWAYGVEAEKKNNVKGSDAKDSTVFRDAYEIMLSNVRRNYPDAEIWCCTLCTTWVDAMPSFVFPYEYAGIHMEVFNTIIKETAGAYECSVIDFYSYEVPYSSIDGTHPDVRGMKTLAELAVQAMTGRVGKRAK